MENITQSVCFWIRCCRDLWTRWFKRRGDGAHEFISIEQSLLETLVCQKLLEDGKTFSREDFYNYLRAKYRHSISDSRSFCLERKGGEIYCEIRDMRIQQGSLYSIRSIDTTETMQDGAPYVEVEMDEGFILEPFENLEFYFSDEPVR